MVAKTIVKTVKTPAEKGQGRELTPERVIVEITKDPTGRTILDVVKVCPISEDRDKCGDELEETKNKLLVALANEKGVMVRPKIVIEGSTPSEE